MPTIQKPTPTANNTLRQPNVSMYPTSSGSVKPATADESIRMPSARARLRTNQLLTIVTKTMNVPNDMPSVISATAR